MISMEWKTCEIIQNHTKVDRNEKKKKKTTTKKHVRNVATSINTATIVCFHGNIAFGSSLRFFPPAIYWSLNNIIVYRLCVICNRKREWETVN